MMRALFLGLTLWLGAFTASAESVGDVELCNSHCLLETIWENAERLAPKQLDRVTPLFLEMVAHLDDENVLSSWEERAGRAYEPAAAYDDYAREKVSRFIASEGWDAFFSHAETRTFPLNSGRPEMMAAAAEHLADESTAQRIYDVMERLGNQDRSKAAFERASFGHALAEAAMRRCDLPGFERALKMTDAPNNIRYAFWRTRMEGRPEDLSKRISAEFDPESSTLLRQAIDGYRDVLQLEACELPSLPPFVGEKR